MEPRIDNCIRGLYAIVDPGVCVCEPVPAAEAILRGGCAFLQLRDKTNDDGTLTRIGRALARLCAQAGVPFIINDRFWLAREIGAQGVHIGQTDAPIETVRRELGEELSIGLSTHTLEQAKEAQARGADLIGVGPIYPTKSKMDADPIVGISGLAEVCTQVTIPVVAIGGINLDRAEEIVRAGAPMAAVISAVCAAADIEGAARALHQRLRSSTSS